jgi:hypothetical protein
VRFVPASIILAIWWMTIVADAGPHALVDGLVIDRDTGAPIAGATVIAEHAGIAVTDEYGAFALALAPAGKAVRDRELTVTAPGYAAQVVRLPSRRIGRLRVELAAAQGDEVIEITGSAPEQTRPLSYQLTADEIRFLPGAANDVLRAAQVLPGVSRIPFAFGGLVLRGTSPRDTMVYLDGIEVPIAFHFGGITSFYPSYMLADLTLTSGGFDVANGRAQGGMVLLTTREPRTDAWRIGGSIGLLDSGAFAEGPLWSGGIIIGVRRSYIDRIVSPFVEDEVPLPSYWDAQIRTSFGDPRRHGRITPMLFAAIDRVASDEIAVTSLFVRGAVPYTRSWGKVSLRVVPWLGWTQLSFSEQDGAQEQSIRRPTYPAGVRSELVRDYAWGHLRGGVDVDSGYLAQTEVALRQVGRSRIGTTMAWTDVATWGEARFKLDGERLAIKPGVRVDVYGISGEVVVDPRLNIHQKLTPALTLRQAIGRFHQPPIPADVDPENGNPALDSSYIDQVSLGLDAELREGVLASVTGFAGYGYDLGVRVYRHGGEAEPSFGGLGPTFELLLEKSLGFSSYRENLGRARLAGAELMVKASFRDWFGFVGYTLSWSQRTDDPRSGQSWRPFELDQRHNLNIAASRRWVSWRLGARLQLVTGNPYSPTLHAGGELPTSDIPVQVPFGARLPTFFQIHARADRRWRRSWGDINFFADIQNVTNRRNVEGRELSYEDGVPRDKDIPGLPILPFIGVEFVPRG